MYVSIHICAKHIHLTYITGESKPGPLEGAATVDTGRLAYHTRHMLPPSEIDLGLCWADFTDLEGKHLLHRIG